MQPTKLCFLAASASLASLVLLPSNAQAITLVSNGIYEAHIQSRISGDFSQFGSWNAVTDVGHPTGSGNNLLYQGTTTTTNFSSLRVYGANSNTDYTFGGAGGGTNLDSFLTAEEASPFVPAGQGARTVWDVSAAGLRITQDVLVTGSTFNDSAIYHTVEILNTGNEALSLGWRNLYDWTVNDPDFDDGPSNQIENADGSVIVAETTNEFTYISSGADLVRVTAAPSPVGGATYQPLLALGFDPGFIAALPVTRPDEYGYVSWPGSFGTAFDYSETGADVTGDSAGLSWFGPDAASAYTIAAGQSVRFTQIVFGVTPDAPPPGGDDTPSIPEPSALLGLLLLGGIGVTTLRQRQFA